MKAIVQTEYGTPDVLELRDVERPVPQDGEALVRMAAAGLHAGDAFVLAGKPYLARLSAGWPKPRHYTPGYDVAGTVEQVGSGVTRLKPGDAVFGACSGGGCAEYVRTKEEHLVPKPERLTFEQAGAVATSALAALQVLRDAAKLQPGDKVLVNGASGGVGSFAVQIAKALGASEVTGVCSTRNVEMVRSLGADHVIDYTREDFTQGAPRYDLIFDNVGNRPFAELRRALTPRGVVQPNGGSGGVGAMASTALRSMVVRQQRPPYLSMPKLADLLTLKELIDAEKLTPVIDRTYPLTDTAEAFRYLLTGHVAGKIVIVA